MTGTLTFERIERLERVTPALYRLGRFTVRSGPLTENPAFRTHHVYYHGRLIGRQLSVPTISDAERMLHPPVYAPPRFVAYTARPGRPRKHQEFEI